MRREDYLVEKFSRFVSRLDDNAIPVPRDGFNGAVEANAMPKGFGQSLNVVAGPARYSFPLRSITDLKQSMISKEPDQEMSREFEQFIGAS